MIDRRYLLNDEQMCDYITRGYVVLKTDLDARCHDEIYTRTLELMDNEGNPGNNILPRVPQLRQVFEDPNLRGALTSVLGADYVMHSHRHCHVNPGKRREGGLHKDSYWGYHKVRHHRTRWAMIFYYPQDTPREKGPTAVVPGSHTYESRESWEASRQTPVPVVGEAGTAALVHFDLWHQATANVTDDTRFMMKFQFVRMSEPGAEPTWRSDCGGLWPGRNGAGGIVHETLWQRVWSWHGGRPLGAASSSDLASLQAELRSDDVAERAAAADALGLMGPAASDALDDLTEALHDDVEAVRLNAAYALGGLGADAVPRLTEALRVEQEGIPLAAAYGLSVVGAEGIEALTGCCMAADEPSRGFAAYALGEMGGDVGGGATSAIADLQGDDSEWVRRNAAEALGTIAGQSEIAVSALTALLRDEDGQVRFNAAYALARHGAGATSAVSALRDALDDENRYVRNNSVEALQHIGTEEANRVIHDFLSAARWCPITTKDSTF